MSYLIPIALTVVAVTITYVTCIRPMRRGQQCHSGRTDANTHAQIRELRQHIQLLHNELDLRTGHERSTEPHVPRTR